MVEATKAENFDDTLEGDDFAFLDEEEIKSEPIATPQQKSKANPVLLKWGAIALAILIGGALGFNAINKKVAKETQATLGSTPPDATKTQDPKTETIALPVPNPKAQPAATSSAATAATTNTTAATSAIAAVNNAITQSQPAATTAANPATTPAVATNEQKSQEEMAALFAIPENDSNNLATALAQQPKANPANKSQTANNNPNNMDIFFGNNGARSRDKNLDPKTQELVKQTGQLQQAVESITQEITENVNHIKNLENKLNDLNNVLAKVNQNIGNIDARMAGFNEAIDSITQDIGNVKKVIAEEDLDIASSNPNKKINEQTLTYKPPGYSIHAIIPGRAWLKSASGQIITIAEGDVIGDYGTVAVIDAANNIVRTSSGVAFR